MQLQFIRNLLDLKDIIVKDVVQLDDFVEVHFSYPVISHCCPVCNESTRKVHDYRKQRIKDIPILNKKLILVYYKRRYKCTSCNKNFFEKVDFIGRYQRITKRLTNSVVMRLRTNFSMSSIAKDYCISPCTVTRLFDCVSYSFNKLPAVLSIDEFKGNTEKGKYHCILVDPVNSKVLDILDKRTLDHLTEYFSKFKDRSNVKYVVIDMWNPYKQAIQHMFPNAMIIIDRFHYVRNCIWALDKIRKRIQATLPYEKGKFIKNSKRLLLASPDKLSDDRKVKLANILRYSDELRLAYLLKEAFMKFVRAKDHDEALLKLDQWQQLVKHSNLKEFKYLNNTVTKWKPEILNSFKAPYSNGCVEGFNNKIKVIKRNAFGFRNFSRFRSRILHCCS